MSSHYASNFTRTQHVNMEHSNTNCYWKVTGKEKLNIYPRDKG